MAKALKKGDKVEWNTSQGKTKGTIKKKLTSTTKIKGHKAAASKAKPEFLVESEKTGKKAAHKAEALKKTKTVLKSPAKRNTPAIPKTKAAAKSTTGAPKKSTTSVASKKASKISTAARKPATVKKAAPKAVKRSASVAKKATAKKAVPGKAPKLNTDQVIKEFRAVVNLTRSQLERWLGMPDSKKLGFKDEIKAGTVGHESGHRILKILSKRRDKYTDDDLRHMQTVVGFVLSHRAQKPPGDIVASNWRYSLMNWGHDPTKYKPARGKA